ncbi:unnamed protein product, partial [Amoebophrya sp. A25]|eukprot:GSA25T00019533001.1
MSLQNIFPNKEQGSKVIVKPRSITAPPPRNISLFENHENHSSYPKSNIYIHQPHLNPFPFKAPSIEQRQFDQLENIRIRNINNAKAAAISKRLSVPKPPKTTIKAPSGQKRYRSKRRRPGKERLGPRIKEDQVTGKSTTIQDDITTKASSKYPTLSKASSCTTSLINKQTTSSSSNNPLARTKLASGKQQNLHNNIGPEPLSPSTLIRKGPPVQVQTTTHPKKTILATCSSPTAYSTYKNAATSSRNTNNTSIHVIKSMKKSTTNTIAPKGKNCATTSSSSSSTTFGVSKFSGNDEALFPSRSKRQRTNANKKKRKALEQATTTSKLPSPAPLAVSTSVFPDMSANIKAEQISRQIVDRPTRDSLLAAQPGDQTTHLLPPVRLLPAETPRCSKSVDPGVLPLAQLLPERLLPPETPRRIP